MNDEQDDWVPLAQPPPRRNCHYLKLEDDTDQPKSVMNNVQAWSKYEIFHAAPAPPNHPVAQDMSGVPNIFPALPVVLPPVASPQALADPVPVPQILPAAGPDPIPPPVHGSPRMVHARSQRPECARCGVGIPAKPLSVAMQGVKCDRCGLRFHYQCANLVRPPKNNSWACEGCLLAMQ